MSRVFTQKLTHEELAEKIWNKALETEKECEWADMDRYYHKDSAKCKTFVAKCYASRLPIPFFSGKISDDLKKVNFDWENYEYTPEETYMDSKKISGFRTLPNGLTYLGVTAGGDWQLPVFAILYFSGKELRAYIPQKGNLWDTKTNKAYDNDVDSVNRTLEFNQEEIIEDIMKRIIFKGQGINIQH